MFIVITLFSYASPLFQIADDEIQAQKYFDISVNMSAPIRATIYKITDTHNPVKDWVR